LMLTTSSGVTMSQDESMRLGVVYACVRLIADSISTLPVDSFVRRDGTRTPYRPRPVWLDLPEVGVSRTAHFQQVLVSLLINGNSFTRILRDDQGVAGLVVLNPKRVEIRLSKTTRRPEYVVDNGKEIVAYEDMIHITELQMPGELRGRSRIDLVKETLGLAKALDAFAQLFFGQGSTVGGLIEYPGNLTREQAKDLADSLRRSIVVCAALIVLASCSVGRSLRRRVCSRMRRRCSSRASSLSRRSRARSAAHLR
jgi:HK97 family phage portal protein